jgi:hypothetical protein
MTRLLIAALALGVAGFVNSAVSAPAAARATRVRGATTNGAAALIGTKKGHVRTKTDLFCVRAVSLTPVANVDEAAGDRRRRRHRRRHEMRAALETLTPFEIAIRSRGAALARR